MTDKPDPLEELKQLVREMRPSFGGGYMNILDVAIAAWEKERARLDREVNQNQGMATMLLNLRAAVEKVRDELVETINVRPGAVMACHLREAADALDAALRGGA